MRVIYTAGVFDLIHRGHLNILWNSKALGDVLVVGVVSDSGCAAYKGRRPVQNVQQRLEAVRRLGFVDVVEIQRTTDPSENLFRFRPDVMTHGDDWNRLLEGNDTLADLGIEFQLLPYTEGVSTTLLRERKVPA
jgi:rfaE bifunctional protein nucleotidyltransferase chain/domain